MPFSKTRNYVCCTWIGTVQNDQCMTSKYHKSDKRADGSLCFLIALAALWCNTLIILRSSASSSTHLIYWSCVHYRSYVRHLPKNSLKTHLASFMKHEKNSFLCKSFAKPLWHKNYNSWKCSYFLNVRPRLHKCIFVLKCVTFITVMPIVYQ